MTKQELLILAVDNIPTQIMFWDSADQSYCAGILIGTTIICGCCGVALDLCEIIEYAEEDGKVPAYELKWVDITDAIAGDWVEEDGE
jgi:hypothetical protein